MREDRYNPNTKRRVLSLARSVERPSGIPTAPTLEELTSGSPKCNRKKDRTEFHINSAENSGWSDRNVDNLNEFSRNGKAYNVYRIGYNQPWDERYNRMQNYFNQQSQGDYHE